MSRRKKKKGVLTACRTSLRQIMRARRSAWCSIWQAAGRTASVNIMEYLCVIVARVIPRRETGDRLVTSKSRGDRSGGRTV